MDDLLELVSEAISLACLFKDGSILMISSVSPEFDINKTISVLFISPISP